jgi:hypothetical protein
VAQLDPTNHMAVDEVIRHYYALASVPDLYLPAVVR